MVKKVDGSETYQRMVCFLYLLIRDHLKIGDVNSLIQDVLSVPHGGGIFSDEILVAKAESIVQQIAGGKDVVKDIKVDWMVRNDKPEEEVAGEDQQLDARKDDER